MDWAFTKMQLWVGAILGATVSILIMFVLAQGLFLYPFHTYVNYHVEANRSHNLKAGSPVKVRDIDVGYVSSVNLQNNATVKITISVTQEHAQLIRKGSTATAGDEIVSGNFLEIKPGEPSETTLKPGSNVPFETRVSMRQKVKNSLEQFNEKLTDRQHSLGQLLHDDGKIYQRLHTITSDLKTASKQLSNVLEAFNDPNKGTIGRVTNDQGKLYDDVHETVVRVKRSADQTEQITSKLNRTVNEISPVLRTRVPSLVDQANKTTLTAQQVIENLNKSWIIPDRQRPDPTKKLKPLPR